MERVAVTAIAPRWRALGCLAPPFVVVIFVFHGLSTTFPTFHGSDEANYHYPTILVFARQLPFPDLRDYRSATGPLFHVACAVAVSLLGFDLQALRLVNVLVSFAAVLAFRRLVERVHPGSPLRWSLLFGLSPYFFGASFILLTDNFGILLALLALIAWLGVEGRSSSRAWARVCAWSALAMLTRQVYVWLPATVALADLVSRDSWRRRLVRLFAIAAACVPLAALAVIWGGLVPPGFQEHHVAMGLVNPRAVVFGIAALGLWWVLLVPEQVVTAIRASRPTVLASIGIVNVVAAVALHVHYEAGDDGLLWRAAGACPTIGGTSVVFWLLVPLGIGFLVNAFGSGDRMVRLVGLGVTMFVLANAANQTVYEKYFDPLLIVFVLVECARRGVESRLVVVSQWCVVAGFAVYPIVSWYVSRGGK